MSTAEQKIQAQMDLVKRMREVRSGLPRWWDGKRQMEAIARDPECIRLLAIADELWEVAS